ncbi:histidine kinase [Bacteroidales bacterium OttesenSCG-928-B11]|nr:histidine kinase [Bacteroidales bacterium OttesenSCG-928-C03]MDL2312725.1 histidine kinase [Bacteroidales bacterium OttesenSCG-928-B11]MDL2326419.1 histidine kinase [Bacteroidales bacterium OttesenSCG-928-A14]
MNKNNLFPIKHRDNIFFSIFIALILNIFYILIFFLGRSAIQIPVDVPGNYIKLNYGLFIFSFFATALYTYVMMTINSLVIRKYGDKKRKTLKVLLINIGASLVLAILLSHTHLLIFGEQTLLSRFLIGNLIRYLLISLLTLFVCMLSFVSFKKQQIAIEYEKLSAENIKTRYEALKNQIDPHFLFNSLGTLKSLIRTDPEEAENYVQKFSNVFRYTLQDKELLPLQDELDFTHAYCELMKIRYGDNLRFNFDIDEKYLNYPSIPISIQTLIENAIKHNMITQKSNLTINIYTTVDDRLCVSNIIQPKKMKEHGVGIGLKNLNERYLLKFKKPITIRQSDNKFTVLLPLVKNENTNY